MGKLDLGLWNITDIEDGRIHIGHDARYASYERLMFGQASPPPALSCCSSSIEESQERLRCSWEIVRTGGGVR